MIITVPQLTDFQVKELEGLFQLCQLEDKGTPVVYWHLLEHQRDVNNTALYYHNEQLLGFLGVYFFYENACEVSLLVAPTHRRQSVASQLLATMYPLLHMMGMETLIFSSKHLFCDDWLPEHGFLYHHSEYHMERYSSEEMPIERPSLSLKTASFMDLDALMSLDEACFTEQAVNMLERFNYLLNNPEYTILLAIHEGKVLGKAHLQWRADVTMLSDIAIFPDFQGRGFGSELIALSINHAISQGQSRLGLDVETKNQGALSIYKRLGFKTKQTYDFWSVATDDLFRGLA